MAITIAAAIEELKKQNEKQVAEQTATRTAIETLNDKFDDLLSRTPTRSQQEEERRERNRRSSGGGNGGRGGEGGGGSLFNINAIGFGNLLKGRGILQIAGAIAGITAAFAGLGPRLSELKKFIITLQKIVAAPAMALNNLSRLFGGKSLTGYISAQVTKIRNLLRRQFTFDPRVGRYRNLTTGRFGAPGTYQRILARLDNVIGNVKKVFSFIKIPESVTKKFENFAKMFKEGGRFAGLMEGLRKNRFVTGFLRFLRPVAAILALFDGFRNAEAELEDREGFFNKWLGGGVGGLVSGTIGSFYGEFANFIRDALFWPIKKLLPDTWLKENEDGSVSINGEANWFAGFLEGLEDFDFNRMLTNMVQLPFNQLGIAFDFITGLFTAEGDSRKKLQEYWDERGFFGAAADVVGWAINLAMSPLNAMLREVENAFFGADPERESQTFTQRISGYVNRLMELLWSVVPSWDDLKNAIANVIPEGQLGDAVRTRLLGIQSPEEALARASEITAEITRLQGIAENADDDGAAMIEGQIAALQSEARSLGVTAPVVSPADVSTNRMQFDTTLPPSFMATLDPASLAAILAYAEANGGGRGGSAGGGGSVPQIVPVPIPVDRLDQGRDW